MPLPAYSQAATWQKFSSSRFASFSSVWYASLKWQPHDSLRARASTIIKSPNSRKSATRPAFSRLWLKSLSEPGTMTFFQNSSRNCWISFWAFKRPFSFLDMPQYSQRTLPSSLWKSSTVRVPFIDKSLLVRELTSWTAALKAGCLSVILFNPVPAKYSPIVYGIIKYPSASPCIKALAPSRFAPWSEKFASPRAKRPGTVVIRL